MSIWLDREEALIGANNIEKIRKAKVAVFGIGGVGSYVTEGLVRAGIENIVLVDNDIVDVTNINRQLIADTSTIGRNKVEVAKERILKINPNANVEIYKDFYSEENKDKLIKNDYTYIVDAIDSVSSKISLIKKAHKENIKIISAMGMGNKLDPTMIEVSDISKTSICPLARVMRKKLKEEGIYKLKVVYSKEVPIKKDSKVTTSISFVPSVCGLIMAGEIIREIIK